MPLSPRLGGVSVQFFRRPKCKTEAKILKSGYLPTAFINFDALLLVTHWSNGLLPGLSCHLRLKLTMPKIFSCRKFLAAGKLAKKMRKTVFLEGKWYIFLLFWVHGDWLIYQCYLIDETARVSSFDILRKHFGFFSDGFWRNFFQ